MLSPKKVKHRKVQKGRMRGKAYRGGQLHFGDYGLMATQCGWLTARQIEAARIALTRHVKRSGKVWINIFPDKPLTAKPRTRWFEAHLRINLAIDLYPEKQ